MFRCGVLFQIHLFQKWVTLNCKFLQEISTGLLRAGVYVTVIYWENSWSSMAFKNILPESNSMYMVSLVSI